MSASANRATKSPNRRRIIVSEFATLDGVVEAPERWRFNYSDPELMRHSVEELHAFDTLLMGRVTYQNFAAYWPNQTHNEFGIADKLNRAPKLVASNSLKSADWNNSEILKGDVVAALRELKGEPGGDVGITGSLSLVGSLSPSGVIDEYRFLTFPLVLGSGRHLFPDGVAIPLELIEAKAFPSGVVLTRYIPAPPKAGA